MLLLWIMLALRYGQGTDYFSHQYIFEHSSTWNEVINNPYKLHGEIGFRILGFLFKGNFVLFIFVVSTLEMWVLYRGINRFSYNNWLSICLFFHTGYMTYFYSLIRQGIVLSVFVGYLVECIYYKQWKRYYTIVFVLTFIHTSSWILMMIPIILKLPRFVIVIISIAFSSIGLLFVTNTGRIFLCSIPYFGEMIGYYVKSDMSVGIFPILERMISGVFIYILYHHIKKENISKLMDIFINSYIFGIGVYFLLMNFPIVSSRLMIYFKILEIYIYPNLLYYSSKWKQVVNLLLVFIIMLMLVKNLNSYLVDGKYLEDVSIFRYPYVSIFNKEKIWKFIRRPFE